MDLGNYERYLNVTLGRENNITTGKIYREVIEKEVRRLGSTQSSAEADSFLSRGAVITSARPSKSFLMSPTPSRTGSSA